MPGEAFQFDWSEDWAIIDGERTKLQVAHFKLSYSRAFVLRAYPQQTHEMLFDAHNHAFRVLGRCAAAGHLRQYANGRRQDRPRKGASGQRPLLGDGQPLPVRGRVLQSGLRLGEGADREERSGRPPSALATHAELPLPGGAERLAGGAMPRAVGPDAARLTTRRDRRRLGRRVAAPDAAFRARSTALSNTPSASRRRA